jgi:hypothetical protein
MTDTAETVLKNTLLGTAVISSGSLAYAVHNLGKRKLLLQRWGIDINSSVDISQKFKQASYDTFLGKIPRIPGVQISTVSPTQNELNTLLAIRNNKDIHYCILDFQNAIFKSNNNFLISSKRYIAPFVLLLSTKNPYTNDFLNSNHIKSASTIEIYSTSFPLYYEEFSFNNYKLESGPEYFTWSKLLSIRDTFLKLLFSKSIPQESQKQVENLKNNIHLFIYSQEPKKLNNTVSESHVQFDIPNLMLFLNSNIKLESQDVLMKDK